MATFDKNVDLPELIPELKDWNGGNGIDMTVGSAVKAITST